MKILRSIRTSLLLITVVLFVMIALAVTLTARYQLIRLIDKSQAVLYQEKLNNVLRILDNRHARLLLTFDIEAYETDFKNSALAYLDQAFRQDRTSGAYPSVLDGDGTVLLSSSHGDDVCALSSRKNIDLITGPPSGSVTLKSATETDYWCMFARFEPWGWTVVYEVPLSVKYADIWKLTNTFILLILLIMIVTMAVLMAFIAGLTDPITRLTQAASAMARGNLDQEMNFRGRGEVGILAESFEAMRSSIRDKMENLARQNLALNREIEFRLSAEMALRESEEKFRNYINNAPDAIILADVSGRIQETNPAATQILGLSRDEILSMHVNDPIPEAYRKKFFDFFLECSRSGIGRGSFPFVRKNGGSGWLSAAWVPLPDGTTLGFFADISEQVLLRERLHRKEKLEAIGLLAGGIAHDFNNQLMGILGQAECIRLEAGTNETVRRCSEGIVKSVKRAGDLTRQLLAFARKGKNNDILFDLRPIIDEVADILRHSIDRRISVRVENSAGHGEISGDPSQIQNALLNLGINARDAMPEGGTLEFKTRDVFLDSALCREYGYDIGEGEYVEISVSDTGVGMSDESLSHLFEPFYTTKDPGKGVGMGLPAVYGTVKDHRGAIEVESSPGNGTTVRLFLPSAARKNGADTECSESGDDGTRTETVPVEDEKG